MINGILGKKIGMTQIFSDKGMLMPVTIIKAGPCVIVRKKTKDRDKYDALQLGFCENKKKNLIKPKKEYFIKQNIIPQKFLKEFKIDNINDYNIGQEIKVDIFKENDYVDVTGITKGKGFAGVIKRWGFSGGRASHGSMFYRAPGSIGASSYPSRVFKGSRMPGHMGNQKETVQKLKIVKVDIENNLLFINGAVPGNNDGLVIIKGTVKKIRAKKSGEDKLKKTKGKAK